MTKIVMVSGGFDPVHFAHLRMMQEASKYGDVVVALNSDDWLMRKKGYVFMPWEERAEIILGFSCVKEVVKFDDSDNTAINAIETYRPNYFANGGDRGKTNTPEQAICDKLGVEMLWQIGGGDKPQSSSWLVKNAIEQLKNNDL